MCGSGYKAWWLCSKGHSYQTAIYNRAKSNGTGCPICSNRQILVGYNDLSTTHPELAKEWHPTKNGDLTPEMVTSGSLKKVWWYLPYYDEEKDKIFNFEWEANISNRALKNSGCPFLTGTVWSGYNDLLTVNPTLASEWNYERNGNITPDVVSPSDQRKMWWKCAICGNEWNAKVSNRHQLGRGCPNCATKKSRNTKIETIQRLKKTLADSNPILAAQWHPTKNGMLTPNDVSAGSSEKVWWLLSYDDPNTNKHFDFEWKATIASRNNGCGCPYLEGKLWIGFNDITVTNPLIIKYWHPTKNKKSAENYTKGSHTKVWWLGECGHEFQSLIAQQCKHFSCPICSREQQSSFPEQAIYYYIKKIFADAINGDRTMGKELDIYIPTLKIGIEYDGEAWHKDIKKDIAKDNYYEKLGIKLIRVREDGCSKFKSQNSIIYTYKYGEWNELNSIISDICFNLSGEKVDIDIQRDELQIYESYLGVKQQGSLGELYPDLIKLWHTEKNGTITPYNVLAGSEKRVWWIDKYGHEYRCMINQMVRGDEHCPYCNNRKLLQGFNDLRSRYPNIASEWASDLNGIGPEQVIYNKGKYWFKCKDCGKIWKTSLANRTRLNVGCPTCGHERQRKIRAMNREDNYGSSLAIAYPQLAQEWNAEKNDILPENVYKYSILKEKYWWKCKVCGEEWQSTIKNRTRGRGCPKCRFSSQYKKVLNVETGEIFDSVTDAATKYNCSASSITNCCKGRIKTVYSYHWTYYEERN